MKKLFLLFFIFTTVLYAEVTIVPLDKAKEIANRTAQSFWGNVSEDKAIPCYSKNDEIIAYRFNFSIDKPFPDKETLIETCKSYYENGDKSAQWGMGEYGYMLISARKDMDVIQSYSDVLSPEYAEGFKMRAMAKEKLGSNISLKKVYYINFENQWFCFTNGINDIYVKVFPKPEALSKQEFHEIVDGMDGFKTGDFSDNWDQYISGNVPAGKSQVWIPNHDGYCKFYDWSYGCTPTAAAMLLSWWDFNSINTSNNYSKLIDYNYQRYDDIQAEWDYQVPNAQKQLAIAMNTDTLTTGGTTGWMIAPGIDQVCDDNGYDFICERHIHGTDSLWYFNKIQNEIGTYQRPILIEIPGHSECCVAYDVAAEQIGVHNTWWGSVEWRPFTDVIRVYTVEAGGAFGNPVNLTSPLGDISYNGNGNGGSYGANGMMEIKWNSDYANNTNLYYSMNGGYNWTTIMSNTLNDGVYDWKIPSGINSQECRIKVEIKASDGSLLGSDGSFGNFEIIPGGTVDILESDNETLASLYHSYFQFSPDYSTWSVVGVGLRPDLPGEDWDVYLYDDNNFSNVIASSMYGESYLDFIVLDGHKAPSQYWGVKFSQYSGIGNTYVEFENGNEILTIGDNPDTWPDSDVVEMYDVYLEPGSYEFGLDITSGAADLGFAIYSSSPSSYYGGRSSNLDISDNTGAGLNESFSVTVAIADYYGVCVWSNDYNYCDYNINIKKAGTWTGAVNNDWCNPGNWVAGIVPDATMDVRIPSVTNKCWVYGSDVACKNLTIEEGTGNYLRIYDNSLHVYGDLTIFAQLMMDYNNGSLIVEGNVDWNNNSSAYFSASTVFTVGGHWYFNTGSNVQLSDGMVYLTGAGTANIKCKSPNCSFNSLYMDKGGSGSVVVTTDSNNPLMVNDDMYIQPGTSFINNYDQDIICRGDLWNSGEFNLSNGTNSNSFIMDGSTQTINMSSANGLFNNLVINPVSSVMLNSDIHIANDITIESGSFVPQANTIHIEGNWTNNVGPDAFLEGSGRVIFSGTNIQYCSNEEFNILEIDNPPGAIYISGSNVICAAYDWTAGAIDVFNGGTFTANNLIDNGIYGKYILNDSSTINLTNTDGYVDLDGELYINGGVMNIYGGTTPSYWPWAADALITMSDGVLDFHDQGIYVYNTTTYSLTNNITGGIIRTSQGFLGDRSDFAPTGGAIELYGSTDANLSMGAGSNFYNVLVNKVATDNSSRKSKNEKRTIQNRDGSVVELTRSEIVTATSELDINGDLVINTGTLNSNNYTIYVSGNANVNSGSILSIQPNGTLELDNGSALNVNSGGELRVIGSVSNLAAISHHTSGYYDFNVYSGGTISAEYGLFEYMTDNGVYVRNGGFVDPLHSFDYCTFQNGYVGSGTLLYVENDEDITITGANFPDASSTWYNVAKILDHGTIMMVGSTGIFAGEDNDYDFEDRITWGVLPAIYDLTIQYSAGTIILNWTYPQSVIQFKVYRSTDPYDFSGATISTIPYTTPAFYSETATGTKYFYRVTAENVSDNIGSREKQ